MYVELGVAALVALLPLPIPALLVLVLLATVSIAIRGGSWLDTAPADTDGALARIGLGLVIGTTIAMFLHFLMGPGTVTILLVHGNQRALVAGLLVALATSVASEMLFRGYVISSMERAWGAAGARAGVIVGALLAVTVASPSSVSAAAGTFVLGIGYALLYLAGRKSLALPIAVHLCLLAQPLIYEFAGW